VEIKKKIKVPSYTCTRVRLCNLKKDFSMEQNLKIIENRQCVLFSPRKKENRSKLRTAMLRKSRSQRWVTSHSATSTLDGLSVKIDNLPSVEQVVLQGKISLVEASLPELLESLANFQEEEE
jgi:hypothetical protein